ncbi:MAG: DNA-3-methyladenine glycosylase [Solirubrobacteraceae bacterium]|nr:DNA-3-methyladenine glycosylase [Solirubrobacteraceae bacterium]
MTVAHPPIDDAGLRQLLEGDVVAAAQGLIGCRIAHRDLTVVIVETEAYHEDEEACHGYRGSTPRAQLLRRPPGFSYVYLSYGIHRLINVVTGSQDVSSAVLLRGGIVVEPDDAAPIPGPGRLGKLLGMSAEQDGLDLLAGGEFRLEPADPRDGIAGEPIAAGPRIGITKAVELPWRFAVSGNPGVSRPRI